MTITETTIAAAALSQEEWDALSRRNCPGCGRAHLVVHALLQGMLGVMSGEPVSSLRWAYDREVVAERVYRVECGECGQVLFSREACPVCGAAGGLARVLSARHGVAVPPRCPLCEYEELTLTAVVPAQLLYTAGTLSRRVCGAEAHEAGFHVAQVDCPCCEETVGKKGLGCVACGRSSLMKMMR